MGGRIAVAVYRSLSVRFIPFHTFYVCTHSYLQQQLLLHLSAVASVCENSVTRTASVSIQRQLRGNSRPTGLSPTVGQQLASQHLTCSAEHSRALSDQHGFQQGHLLLAPLGPPGPGHSERLCGSPARATHIAHRGHCPLA